MIILNNSVVKSLIILYNNNMIKGRKLNIFNKAVAIIAVIFALCSLIIAGFFVVYMRVPVNGLSMYPTLNYNLQATSRKDIVYINRFKKAAKNDIVVLDLTDNQYFGNHAIKRLIATEGDTVNIIANADQLEFQVLVNGEVIDSRPIIPGQVNSCSTFINFEKYLSEVDVSKKNENGLIVGEDQIFVLGDNWNLSKDSSLYGTFNKNTIIGKVDYVITPNDNEIVKLFKQIFS